MLFDFEFWVKLFLSLVSIGFSIASIAVVMSVGKKFEQFAKCKCFFYFLGSIGFFMLSSLFYFLSEFNDVFEYVFYPLFAVTGFFLVTLAFRRIDIYEEKTKNLKCNARPD